MVRHFVTRHTGISKIISMYGNLKDKMKLDVCICETLSYIYGTMEVVFVGVGNNYH